MSNNVTDLDKKVTSELPMPSPIPSEKHMLFQIFFLDYDQSQSVEVVETDEIDFGEIIQRLKMGESVFIKYKNTEKLEPHPKLKEGRQSPWYFTRC